MAVNILELFKNQVIDQIAGTASSFVGESENTTKGVLETLAPTLLGSLIQKGSTESGASSILNMLKQDNYDGNVLGNMSSLLSGGGGNLSSIMDMGLPVVKMLLGDKLGSIVDWVSSNKNAKSSSVSSLLSLAAPFLLGLIGKQVKSDNLGASGLMSLLGSQSSWVKSLLPAGLSSLANFSLGGSDSRSSYSSSGSSSDNSTGGGGLGKFLPFLLLLLGLLLFWYFMKSCKKDKTVETTEAAIDTLGQGIANVADSVGTKVGDAMSKTAGAISGALNAAGDWVADLGSEVVLKLKDGTELKVGENSTEKRLIDFIKAGPYDEAKLKENWFTFDRLYFQKGKSTLTPESSGQLKHIAAIMKEYTNVNIKLGGYTDSDGDDAMNMKLSDERAKSAKLELQKLGIGAGRIEAEGYGEQHPICPENNDAACKARNRRIDVRITKM